MTSAELFAKARSLEALADDVETCLDAIRSVTTTSDWECDNATDVRAGVTHWRSVARTAAAHLREEAVRVRGNARTAEADERAATTSGAR